MKTIGIFFCAIVFVYLSHAQENTQIPTVLQQLQELRKENLELKKQMLEMQKQIAESLKQNQEQQKQIAESLQQNRALLQQNREIQEENRVLVQQIRQDHRDDMKRLGNLENRQVRAWSARNTGFALLDLANQGWTPIPGLAVTVELSEKCLLQMTANGTQRAYTGDYTHVGYRLVIDGIPQSPSNSGWGQRIHMNRATGLHWAIWTLVDFIEVDAGRHTIEVQAIGNGTCAVICGDFSGDAGADPIKRDYAGGTIQVIAVPR